MNGKAAHQAASVDLYKAAFMGGWSAPSPHHCVVLGQREGQGLLSGDNFATNLCCHQNALTIDLRMTIIDMCGVFQLLCQD